jgi:hypothetical protein
MLVARDVTTLLSIGGPYSKEAGGGTAAKGVFTISNTGVAATSIWVATASAAATDALAACTIVAATVVRAKVMAAGLLYSSARAILNNSANALIM